MEAADALAPAPKRSVGRRLADLFHGRPRLQVGALLAGPAGWLVIGYLGSLAVLLIAAFWSVDALSGETIKSLSTSNYKTLVDAQVAEYFGEAPAQSKACANTKDPKFCAEYHAADPGFWKRVYYWNTPVADCGNGSSYCKDYNAWVQAWTSIKG